MILRGIEPSDRDEDKPRRTMEEVLAEAEEVEYLVAELTARLRELRDETRTATFRIVPDSKIQMTTLDIRERHGED